LNRVDVRIVVSTTMAGPRTKRGKERLLGHGPEIYKDPVGPPSRYGFLETKATFFKRIRLGQTDSAHLKYLYFFIYSFFFWPFRAGTGSSNVESGLGKKDEGKAGYSVIKYLIIYYTQLVKMIIRCIINYSNYFCTIIILIASNNNEHIPKICTI
jgi:hypothetical protein